MSSISVHIFFLYNNNEIYLLSDYLPTSIYLTYPPSVCIYISHLTSNMRYEELLSHTVQHSFMKSFLERKEI